MASDPVQDEAKVDPAFEFEAPKYIDFTTHVDNDAEDAWFEQQGQPAVAAELKTSDLLEGGNDDFGLYSGTDTPQPNNKRNNTDPTESERPKKKHRVANAASQHLTVPHTPQFATSLRVRRTITESIDDAQQRYMAAMLVEQAKRRRLNSFYKKKALYGTVGYLPTRSTKPLTEPEEVHFHMDDRLRGIPVEEEPKREVIVEKTESGLTIPRPFQFNVDARVKPSTPQPPKSPFVSFKQKMIEIQKKTPKRFRTLPRNRRLWKLSPPPAFSPKLTVPEQFAFATDERLRPTHELSSAEREELEMANMPQFKALPLDTKVLESDGQLGLSRVPKQPLTEPESPKLSTEVRAAVRDVPHEEEQIQLFKARELDRSIFNGPPRGVPSLPHKEATIPESPCLITKFRSQLHPAPAPPKEQQFVFKAQPMPILDEPFVPVKFETKLEVEPFNLHTEQRGQSATKKFQEKLRKQKRKEKQQRNFKAQPMPIPETPAPVFHFNAPITTPQPFNLISEVRGEQHQQKFQEKLQEEEKQKKEQAQFKAQPIPDTPPFEPRKSDKPLTVINDFVLNSDARSQKRQQFEHQKTEKAKAAEEARKQQEEEKRIEEEKFIKEMRKNLVHKPLPIMAAKPVLIHPSSQPLTDPKTPNLRTRKRAHTHAAGRDL